MLNLDDKLVNSIAECIIKVGINILLVLEEHLVVLIILHVKQCFCAAFDFVQYGRKQCYRKID